MKVPKQWSCVLRLPACALGKHREELKHQPLSGSLTQGPRRRLAAASHASVCAARGREIGASPMLLNAVRTDTKAHKRFPIVYLLVPARRATITSVLLAKLGCSATRPSPSGTERGLGELLITFRSAPRRIWGCGARARGLIGLMTERRNKTFIRSGFGSPS
jgi:hypothetical protein